MIKSILWSIKLLEIPSSFIPKTSINKTNRNIATKQAKRLIRIKLTHFVNQLRNFI